jgi:predicted nucleic acid-binding protein
MASSTAGNVIDLSDSRITLPSLIVVDTNILVELLASSFGTEASPANGARAAEFFVRLKAAHATGIVTPAIYAELVHVLVRNQYRTVLKRNRQAIVQRYGQINSWVDLYKHDPSILQDMRSILVPVTTLLIASGLYFLDYDELNPISSGNAIDQELVDIMCRYGLDSNDAMLLIEAQRIPVTDIATFDLDLRRAHHDFRIYTWV